MARTRVTLPDKFSFTTSIPVRITDLNYGGHVGNDTILSIIHEARAQFFAHFEFSELSFAGAATIMADAAIEFKAELFYGDSIIASVAVGEFTRVGFDLYYKLERKSGSGRILVAIAKTGMVCFDYEKKKIVPVPEAAKKIMG